MKTSNNQYSNLVTLHLVTNGNSELWDWEHVLNLNPNETVQVVQVTDA